MLKRIYGCATESARGGELLRAGISALSRFRLIGRFGRGDITLQVT